MKLFITMLALAATGTLATAKLPPLSDEAKAKAAETAAKTAWTDKVGAYKLCLAMDKTAVRYLAEAGKAGKAVAPTPTPACTDPGPFAYVAPPATPPAAPTTAAAPATAPAPAPAPAPAAAKPLEAAGAHSPPGTAVSPPNTKTPAAEQAPAKKP